MPDLVEAVARPGVEPAVAEGILQEPQVLGDDAVDVIGRSDPGDDLAVADEVVADEGDGRVLEVAQPGRQDDQVVGAGADVQPGVADRTEFLERLLADQVVLDLLGLEKVDEGLEILADRLESPPTPPPGE